MSRTITFNELLSESLDVDGLLLDAKVTVIVRKSGAGKHASFDIEFFDMGDVYLNCGVGELIKLDQESFKTRHKSKYGRFINACELLALKKASLAQEHEFDAIEEFAV